MGISTMVIKTGPVGTALFSSCERYRYRLEIGLRGAGAGSNNPVVAFIMVNPSTASHNILDPTIKKCIGFGHRLKAREIIVGNLFAYRSTNIAGLNDPDDPIGPKNDECLLDIMVDANIIVCAWGPVAKVPKAYRDRWRYMAGQQARLQARYRCLGVAKDGQPRHPLMVAYETPVQPWVPPAQ